MADRIKLRRDTAANWTATNPVLAQGEPGFETDTDFLKVGDGVTPWSALGYVAGVGAFVSKIGDTMTGPLSVPAGASGNQVPRRSEVVGVSGNESVGGVKTFTSKPKVPAGATGDEVPQAQEIFGKGQSWQTVTRTHNVTYINSTGKPIILTIAGWTTATTGSLAIEVGADNHRIALVSYAGGSPVPIGTTAIIPDGEQYRVVVGQVSSVVVKEYR